ncbi:hypothetical protein TNIN_473341 [Trichonephila inaurata madagascariensis]|uniref:Uncharacterized protein n=1 Tax=Trichonephila inaurata madagascariensis TaxID=2747483 RepID=A0A8X6X3T2_9ARAC|nr:hypothetical protein TNIN_473341 [Trichonephila inaurata madagascariensis]
MCRRTSAARTGEIGGRRSKIRDQDRIKTRADCFAKRKTREESLFMCWPSRDGENERSLLEDLVMRRNCIGPTPSRETTTRRLHSG